MVSVNFEFHNRTMYSSLLEEKNIIIPIMTTIVMIRKILFSEYSRNQTLA